MSEYMQGLKAMLAEKGADLAGGEITSLLEEIYYFYSGAYGGETETIKACSEELDRHIGNLCFEKRDRIWDTVNAMCAEQDRIAFLAGAKTGACLTLELLDL